MKNKIQYIIIAIIVAISGHILINNLENMAYIKNEKYIYDFVNGSSIVNIKKTLKEIEVNIALIDKMENSNIPDEKFDSIKKEIKESYDKLSTLKILSYTEKNNEMNAKEFLEIVFDSNNQVLSFINIYKGLAEYNNSLNSPKFIEYSFMQLVANDSTYQKLIHNYRYNIYDMSDYNMSTIVVMNNISMKYNTLKYLTDLVLESGDINE